MSIPDPQAQITLGRLLRQPYEALARRIYGRMAEEGFPEIRPAHSGLLRNIGDGGARVADLAALAGITKQSMAYLSESLQGAGYVTVTPDPGDRRAKLVVLTERGRAAVATLTRLSLEAEAELAGHMGAEKVARLRGLLEEAAGALSEG